jgi:hypothetical protein
MATALALTCLRQVKRRMNWETWSRSTQECPFAQPPPTIGFSPYSYCKRILFTVWNRSPEAAEALVASGARRASSPKEAVSEHTDLLTQQLGPLSRKR